MTENYENDYEEIICYKKCFNRWDWNDVIPCGICYHADFISYDAPIICDRYGEHYYPPLCYECSRMVCDGVWCLDCMEDYFKCVCYKEENISYSDYKKRDEEEIIYYNKSFDDENDIWINDCYDYFYAEISGYVGKSIKVKWRYSRENSYHIRERIDHSYVIKEWIDKMCINRIIK